MTDEIYGLNLGAGVGWQKAGWTTIDHKKGLLSFGETAWATNFPSGRFDVIFTSHMLEHIPHLKVDALLKECSRILKLGGAIRVLCPNLAVIARAYVEKDDEMFSRLCREDPTIRQDLGRGGKLMNFMISPGADSLLFARNGECISGYAHVYSYDFEMLRALLERHGFGDICECRFAESRYEFFREPLHIIGASAEWQPECEWADRAAGTTGFDRGPWSSLIVEAKKISEDATTAAEYGTAGHRGLDPVDMAWLAVTRGYLDFSWHKLHSMPRTWAYQLSLILTRLLAPPRSRVRTLLKRSLPPVLVGMLKRWAGGRR